MGVSVTCKCNVERVIDTAKVGPWRLRCKQCGDVLYDPSASPKTETKAAPPRNRPEDLEAKAKMVLETMTASDSGGGGVEDSTFQRWLEGSGELKVLISSDGATAPKCSRHPKRRILAACTRCQALLCKFCLDRIDDQFACTECVAKVACEMEKSGELTGVMSWFKKVFGAK